MTVSMTTISAITKEIYEGGLRDQLNNDTIALKRIERTSNGVGTNSVGGKYVTFPIHYGRNAGIGSRKELEDLPVAGAQATAAAQLGLKYHYGSIALSGQTLKLANTNVQSFVSAMDLETKGLKADLSVNLNRQVYGDGTGLLAKTSTTGAGTTLTITSGMDSLGVNMIVDVWAGSDLAGDTGTKKGTVTITAVTDNEDGTGSLTVTPSVTPGASAVLANSASNNREWTGLGAIVKNSGTLYNIDPTVVSQWAAYVDDNGGASRPLSEGRIIKAVDRVRKRGGKISVMLTSLGVRRSYFALLSQQRAFVNTGKQNQSFEGGFTGLPFTTDQGEVPIVADTSAPYNTMWGLSEDHLKVYREADWSFMDMDGSMWYRLPGSAAGTIKDAYGATMFQYSELGTDRRGVHFRINDLAEA